MGKMMKTADYSRVGTIISFKNKTSKRPDAMVPFKSKQGFNDPDDKEGGYLYEGFHQKSTNKLASILMRSSF